MAERGSDRRVWVVSLLTAYSLLVHGYHPYSEDGGLYAAGIEKLLQPALYPHWTAFVTEHLRFSLFAPLVAGIVRVAHLPLPWVLFYLYVASIWTTLYAAWMVIARATESRTGRAGAVTLLACWLTIPIAGTSLMLTDPYVTARNFSTPLALLAVAYALDLAAGMRARRSGLLCLTALMFAGALHPLMAGYALATVAVVLCVGSRQQPVRRWGPVVLLAAAMAGAGVLQARAPAESANYVWVAMTRYYWFPFRWEWYEQLGLVAPFALLWWLGRTGGARRLANAGRLLGGIALVVAVAFSRAHLQTHLVARMQPLRCFQMVYELMILLLGAWLGDRLLKRAAWRWRLLLAVFAGLMFFVQRSTYPASAHLELPGREPRNPWVQAFVWARQNTPQDALFALDAHYITRDGEDAQTFRAIAERSAVADYSKDGGEASITPELTADWVRGQAAQTGLDQESDAERRGKLAGLGVDWVVLESASRTAWVCPYRNDSVKVCRLP